MSDTSSLLQFCRRLHSHRALLACSPNHSLLGITVQLSFFAMFLIIQMFKHNRLPTSSELHRAASRVLRRHWQASAPHHAVL